MELIPVKTKIFTPPKDDLFVELDKVLGFIKEEDIVLITSKVVSIHEGRCFPTENVDKRDLVHSEADYFYEVPETKKVITINKNAIIGSAGIDESNSDNHYILLPEDGYKSARYIHKHLTEKFDIKKLGVVITDSHSTPLRYGVMGISIGSWGIEPIEYHAGKKDLFGRKLKYSKTNLIDSLAASSTLVSGECSERTPIVIARDVPNISFTSKDTSKELFVEMKDDSYRFLFDRFKKGGQKN